MTAGREQPLVAVNGGQRAMFVLASRASPPGDPASGAGLSLLRSVDGGAHWKLVTLPA
jgi:hypothetical protein